MYNPFSLKGKHILVTGASSGIGRATAIECTKLGARVTISGRNEERLKSTLSELEGFENTLIVADLTNKSDVKLLVSSISPIDGFVNNAGINRLLLIPFINSDALHEIIQVNTIAPILLFQQLLESKKIGRNSSVVFTSSTSGTYNSSFGSAMYSTSKAAINGFVKNAALDLAKRKIRVNSVSPGMVVTPMSNACGIVSAEEIQLNLKKYPLGRYGKPEEVAYAIIYLLSDASNWVTGTNLLIDGGLTLE